LSEFTDGVLVLRKHRDKAQEALKSLNARHKFRDVNAQWSAIFVEEANPKVDPLRRWLIEHSRTFPILFFEHPADHGWGYRIFHSGRETASLFVDYELTYTLYIHGVQNLYPDIDPHVGIDSELARAVQAEIESSDWYREIVLARFQNSNIEQFAHFVLAPETLRELAQIVTVDRYLHTDSEQVQEFKRVLNLKEMEWKSYHYLELDEQDGRS
jgi:hypothetical protein